MRPRAANAGCVVIDNSSLYRYDPQVPADRAGGEPRGGLSGYRNKMIIANPNCSTAQMVVALKPLHDRARIKRVVVSTYQSVSGAGKEGMDELWEQTKGRLRSRRQEVDAEEVPEADRLQRHSPDRRLHGGRHDQGGMEDDGRDEEDPRSLDQASPRPACACRSSSAIPRRSTSSSRTFLDEDEARDILREAPGVMVDRQARAGRLRHADRMRRATTPPSSAASVRTRTIENGLNLWCVSDNLRKGAALNAVQIAELYGREVLKRG